MGSAETTCTQVGMDLLDAYQGYPGVSVGAFSSGSGGGGGGVSGDREYGR